MPRSRARRRAPYVQRGSIVLGEDRDGADAEPAAARMMRTAISPRFATRSACIRNAAGLAERDGRVNRARER
jgi:hypothetical protein